MTTPVGSQRDPRFPRAVEFFPEETFMPRCASDNLPGGNEVSALWNKLFQKAQIRRQNLPPTRLFTKNEVALNETGVGCLDNEHVVRIGAGMSGANAKPIHAHRISPPSQDIAPITVTYAAGQSPPAESFKDFLTHAVQSRQGVFEIVSPKAHYDAEKSRTKSLVELLKTAIAKACESNSELVFGNRYICGDLVQIAGKGLAGDKDDFVQYELSVTDRSSGDKVTIPLTQAGLKFTGRVLQPEEIRRASALVEAHQFAVQRHSDARQTGASGEQLILSRAGVGRNATVITYQKIASLIESGRVNEASLDRALEEEIDSARARRGPTYVHSIEQLGSLRTALLDKIAMVSHPFPYSPIKLPRLSSTAASLRQALISATASSFSEKTTNNQNATPPQTEATNEVIESTSAVTKTTANTNLIRTEINPPKEDVTFQVLQQTKNNTATESIGEPGEAQKSIETEPSAASASGETVVEVTSAKSDDTPVKVGPENPIQPTRYTNNEIDMTRADLLLAGPRKGMNFQRNLAADDGGSWWRAAFVSVLMEHKSCSPNMTLDAPQKILKRIQSLGPEFTEEATVLEQMMKQLTYTPNVQPGERLGMRGFMTDLQPVMRGNASTAARPLFESGISRLKAVGEDEDDPSRPGETALKKVAQAMLGKAGYSESEVKALFNADNTQEGSATHIIELMNQLGAREAIIYTRPWEEVEPGSAEPSWLKFEAATIDCYTMNKPLGPLADVDDGVIEGDELQKFIYAQAHKPIIVAEHGRFSVQIHFLEAQGKGYKC